MKWVAATFEIQTSEEDGGFAAPFPTYRNAVYDHQRGIVSVEIRGEDAPVDGEAQSEWHRRVFGDRYRQHRSELWIPPTGTIALERQVGVERDALGRSAVDLAATGDAVMAILLRVPRAQREALLERRAGVSPIDRLSDEQAAQIREDLGPGASERIGLPRREGPPPGP